jgi:hypothetical protein
VELPKFLLHTLQIKKAVENIETFFGDETYGKTLLATYLLSEYSVE